MDVRRHPVRATLMGVRRHPVKAALALGLVGLIARGLQDRPWKRPKQKSAPGMPDKEHSRDPLHMDAFLLRGQTTTTTCSSVLATVHDNQSGEAFTLLADPHRVAPLEETSERVEHDVDLVAVQESVAAVLATLHITSWIHSSLPQKVEWKVHSASNVSSQILLSDGSIRVSFDDSRYISAPFEVNDDRSITFGEWTSSKRSGSHDALSRATKQGSIDISTNDLGLGLTVSIQCIKKNGRSRKSV
jgi:hypothetical protein